MYGDGEINIDFCCDKEEITINNITEQSNYNPVAVSKQQDTNNYTSCDSNDFKFKKFQL